ncbi:hypothetical protein [Corynebacterium uterequi]|uniref:Uncharacterized protein n=1 Tax=Corynebacterium uterequi TaxID=1072256 RepID=A0A0G3HF75_9CORY|nr:hypothetical protein [Corynebacterium uterequi]AKK12001.1 hypothetical protein CUTER_10170 [Corynebacterium uterequi]
MRRRHIGLLTLIIVLVAVVSVLSNIMSVAELEGRAPRVDYVRGVASKLVNSGTLWAAVPFVAGAWSRRWWVGAVAGCAAAMASLVVHYGLGTIFGMFTPMDWVYNAQWFFLALVLCPLLGLMGFGSQRPGLIGDVLLFTVPVGALAEPLVTSLFTPWERLPWPDRYSDITTGAVLVLAGAAGVVWAAREVRRRHTRLTPGGRRRAGGGSPRHARR